jgi:prevent-host-death family protein
MRFGITAQKAIRMQVNVHQAKSQLSQLLAAVENGDEVVIARNGAPVAKLVPVKKRGGMILGVLEAEGKALSTPSDAVLARVDAEVEAMFYESGELAPAPLAYLMQEKRAPNLYAKAVTRSVKRRKSAP